MQDNVTVGAVSEYLRAIGLNCHIDSSGQTFFLVIEGTAKRTWECSFYSSTCTAKEKVNGMLVRILDVETAGTHPKLLAFSILKLLANRLQKGTEVVPTHRLSLKEKLGLN